jgi:hypothetical protein
MKRKDPMSRLAWLAILALSSCTRMQAARHLDAPSTASGPSITDMPCDSANLLSAYCWSCHGTTPSSDAPMSLVTMADLTAPSIADPSKTMAQQAIVRIQDPTSPMPPAPASAVPADQLAAFQAWVDGGMAAGTCMTSNPYDTPPVCTSNSFWDGGEGSRMAPGQACISCHSQGEGPRFAIAGTVYPTAHEPDDCNGTSSGTSGSISVVITGANGQSITLTPNSVGNFSSRSGVGLPYTAQVISGGQVRAMSTPQTTGDCNSCHTQTGQNGAPGRILAP